MLAPVQVGRKVSSIQFSGLDTYAYIDHGTEYNVRHRVTGGRAGKLACTLHVETAFEQTPRQAGAKPAPRFTIACIKVSLAGYSVRIRDLYC